MNLFDAFAAAASEHGARVALWAGGDTMTYSEMLGVAERLATALLESGVRPGDRVAILARRGIASSLGVVAALRAGCVYVPLNRRYPIARNRKVLELSRATGLVIDNDCLQQFGELLAEPPPSLRAVVALEPVTNLPESRPGLETSDHRAVASVSPRASWPSREPGDDCYLIFTSGSTGEPKGVPITHANVLAYRDGLMAVAPTTHDDRVIQLADLSFDLSVQSLLALTTGAALYTVPERSNLLATRFVEEHELTVWISVPSAAGLAKQAGLLEPGTLPSLRHVHFCGEALHGTVAAAFAAAAPNAAIYNLYGPTEATVEISWYRYGTAPDDATSVVAIGVPLRDQEMGVFDAADRPLPDGEIGELLLAGSQLTRGYWEAPALDALKFTTIAGTRWYRSGDLARRTAKGFEYAGRTDQQTKILGFRVELLEIERTLRAVLARESVAVVPWPVTIDGGAEGTVAFAAGAPIDTTAAFERMRALLPPYMVPARVVWIDELPLNANGKTDYQVLRNHPALRTPP